MCDFVPGELLLAFHCMDLAAVQLIDDISNGKLEHVTYIESMRDRLRYADLPQSQFPLELVRVSVPEGSEQWKITFLHWYYARNVRKSGPNSWAPTSSDDAFAVSPNHWLSAAGYTAGGFSFAALHDRALAAIGTSIPPAGFSDVKIAVIDSGIADDFPDPPLMQNNFIDWRTDRVAPGGGAPDETGHGTLVALLIHAVAPTAKLLVHKVLDESLRASEWDAEAALFASGDADIVNLSLEFGFGRKNCPRCGRESGSARSHVFETVLARLFGPDGKTVVVAAAGNGSRPQLSYPARFGSVVAVGSLNSRLALSSFSNYGSREQHGDSHLNHYVMLGGESGEPPEVVGTFGVPEGAWCGTSFAAAYATGVIARVMERMAPFPARQAGNVRDS